MLNGWVTAIAALGLLLLGAGINAALNESHRAFLEHPTEWLLVLFTGLLAAYTAMLFHATRTLETSSRKSSERQLRAYVAATPMLTEDEPNFDGAYRFHGQIAIRNFGSTPAYRVRHSAKCKIIRNDDLATHQWEYEEPEVRDSVLQPGQRVAFSANLDEPGDNPQATTPEKIQEIFDKNANVWIWGVVKYDDAFGNGRKSNFRYKVGKFQIRDHSYGIAEDGNNAT